MNDTTLKAAVEALNARSIMAVPACEWERLKRIEAAALVYTRFTPVEGSIGRHGAYHRLVDALESK